MIIHVKCPHCGEELDLETSLDQDEGWETFDEEECDECGGFFSVHVEVDVRINVAAGLPPQMEDEACGVFTYCDCLRQPIAVAAKNAGRRSSRCRAEAALVRGDYLLTALGVAP